MTQLANNPKLSQNATRPAPEVWPAGDCAAPRWARDLAGNRPAHAQVHDGIEWVTRTSDNATLVSAIARGARVNDCQTFHRRAIDIYRMVREAIDATPCRRIVRMWNHIPGIHDQLDAECDRYMHFNAARFKAMCEWFDGAANIPARVPAASGVGDEGNDLTVHALAMRDDGVPIENPRQTPAFRYSKKFGPLPPCFARATLVGKALLISGTAAITGEQSQCLGDLDRQLALTLENLRVLIRSAWPALEQTRDALHLIEDVRIYVKRDADRSKIESVARDAFPSAVQNSESVQADLCRAELLVEIEGVARH